MFLFFVNQSSNLGGHFSPIVQSFFTNSSFFLKKKIRVLEKNKGDIGKEIVDVVM